MNKMNVKTVLAMTLSISLFGSCQMNLKKQDRTVPPTNEAAASVVKNIPFTVADKYFVNNTVKEIGNPKITTKDEFNRLFGMASVMGENGLPTKIDFSKQYVVAVVKPETDQNTKLIPVSLQLNEKKEITFSYKTEKGKKQTYKMRPSLIIIVDKAFDGNVVVKEIN